MKFTISIHWECAWSIFLALGNLQCRTKALCLKVHLLKLHYIVVFHPPGTGVSTTTFSSHCMYSNSCIFQQCAGLVDTVFTMDSLINQLELAAGLVERAERYELLGNLYRILIPIYEARRNYQALVQCYSHLYRVRKGGDFVVGP